MLEPFEALDIDANETTAALTDGLLVLRFLFGFSGATLLTGAVDDFGCSRCTLEEISAYLLTLAALLDVDGDGEVPAGAT
ncbi:MAG TPA: hypothetical protein VNB06_17100 [Thermoanaerobaculia bacterium]|nr:hypothetical protein [Thermoanaerobaculia bacterium]